MPDKPFVTLISPQKLYSHSSEFYIGRGGTPPLNLAYLARSLDNESIPYQIIDTLACEDHFRSPIYDLPVQGLSFEKVVETISISSKVIGISSMFTSEFLIVRELIKKIKEKYPNKIIILGGEHASAMAPAILKYEDEVDFIFYGESENSFTDFIKNLMNGEDVSNAPGIYRRNSNKGYVKNPALPRMIDIDDHYPLWDKIPLNYYLDKKLSLSKIGVRSLPILTTRGCPYKCTFCSNEQMWGTRYVMRSIPSIAKEMEEAIQKHKVTNFDFQDLSTSINKKWFKSLLENLIEKFPGITWEMSVGTRSEILDEEILLLLKKSGVKQLAYAPETGSPEMSKKIQKRLDHKKLYDSIKTASQLGIEIKTNTIIGFPDESIKDLILTLWMTLKLGWYGTKNVCIFIFSPYPGSILFDQQYNVEEINREDYNKYLLYQTVNTPGARVFNPKEVFLFPKEQVYTFIGNVFSVFAYMVFISRRPRNIIRLIKNVLSASPQGPIEVGLYSILKKLKPTQQESRRP